jgi:cobalt-zinc-cadmium efflux system membrane fusion protein
MRRIVYGEAAIAVLWSLWSAGCGRNAKADSVERDGGESVVIVNRRGASLVQVDHPERFALATATRHMATAELKVTGVVSADISRNVPVISLASGRILEIHARLGDTVTQGQLLMRVQSADISQACSDYRQAVADEKLARTQLARSLVLFDKGAIAKKDLEAAQEVEEKASVAVETALERLRVLGADKDHLTAIVDIRAPVSGVITDQQVTAAAGTQGLASPNAFTISDLSRVWILCDVYENDLRFVHLGQSADIRLNAFPENVYKGLLSNIGPILDPNIRAAKVRIEVQNPGLMRLGMFVQATFHSLDSELHAVLPSSSVLHLHDRDWVYVPEGGNAFRRVEVRSGKMIAPGQQEILSGIRAGDRVVSDALDLQNTVEH